MRRSVQYCSILMEVCNLEHNLYHQNIMRLRGEEQDLCRGENNSPFRGTDLKDLFHRFNRFVSIKVNRFNHGEKDELH